MKLNDCKVKIPLVVKVLGSNTSVLNCPLCGGTSEVKFNKTTKKPEMQFVKDSCSALTHFRWNRLNMGDYILPRYAYDTVLAFACNWEDFKLTPGEIKKTIKDILIEFKDKYDKEKVDFFLDKIDFINLFDAYFGFREIIKGAVIADVIIRSKELVEYMTKVIQKIDCYFLYYYSLTLCENDYTGTIINCDFPTFAVAMANSLPFKQLYSGINPLYFQDVLDFLYGDISIIPWFDKNPYFSSKFIQNDAKNVHFKLWDSLYLMLKEFKGNYRTYNFISCKLDENLAYLARREIEYKDYLPVDFYSFNILNEFFPKGVFSEVNALLIPYGDERFNKINELLIGGMK